jgi:hypothetical protein
MANKIAGIDVHKKVLMVVVMDPATPDVKPERRRFSTMPIELQPPLDMAAGTRC